MTSSSASRSTPKPEEAEAEPEQRRRWLGPLLVLALFAAALGLRARGVEHGMPRNYVPDTHVVRSALGMAQEKSLAPPVGRYSTYPNLVPYLLLPAYGGYFALGSAEGRWEGVSGFKEHVLAKPAGVHLIARWLLVLMGALTPLLVLRAARAAGLGAGAWFAAALTATGLMHVHFSVQERPWGAVVFFAALAAWPAALYATEPTRRRLLLCGLAAALGAACHQSGFFLLALPGFAWLTSVRGWTGADLKARLVEGTLCVAAFLAVAIVVGYPSYLLHGMPTSAQTIGGDQADLAVGGQSINFGREWSSVPKLGSALFGYDPVLLLLGLAGALPLLRRRAARGTVLFALVWGAFFLTHSNPHIRYLLPFLVLLALPAGALLGSLWERGPAARVAALILALLPLVPAWRLGSVLSQDDSRVGGEALLADLGPESFVLIDRYGPVVDLDRGSLETLMTIREATGGTLYNREARRLQALASGELEGGVRALYAADLFEIDEITRTVTPRAGLSERYGATATEVIDALGFTHVMLVNRIAVDAPPDPLWTVANGTDLRTLGPWDAESWGQPSELRLPMELEFPLTALWRVERPGPELVLRELP